MGSNDNVDPTFLISLAYQQTYCDIAATTMIIYDIILTFNRERTTIWKRKFSVVTLLFLSMRYFVLITQIMSIVNEFQPSVLVSCRATLFVYYTTGLLTRLSSAVFHALRVWAIWGRQWLPLLIVLPVALLPITLVVYQATTLEVTAAPGPFPIGGCSSGANIPYDYAMRFAITSRASAMTLDAMVIIATWMKTWSILQGLKRMAGSGDVWRFSLPGMLLRDGTLYFLVLFVLNTMALVFNTTPRARPFDLRSLFSIDLSLTWNDSRSAPTP